LPAKAPAPAAGVAGIVAHRARVNVGFSVDQSHTSIDVAVRCNRRRLISPRSASTARSTRDVDLGGRRSTASQYLARAATLDLGSPAQSYDAPRRRADELSTTGLSNRAASSRSWLEYVRAATGALHEVGGLDPLMASGATLSDRGCWPARRSAITGSSTARSWISRLCKFVDNFSQAFSSVV